MKTLTIYSRTILKRTGFRKYPYKEETQTSVFYGVHKWENHLEDINNQKLLKPFQIALKTRKKQDVENYIKRLGRSEHNKWLKTVLTIILKGEREQ